jgi:glycosyltransferase involved in cell wall biosynthesis
LIENGKFGGIYVRHSEYQFGCVEQSKKQNVPVILECNSSVVWKRKHWSRVRFPGSFSILHEAEQYAFSLADAITVVSEEMKKILMSLSVPAEKIYVNPNGVDTDMFHPGIKGEKVRSALGLNNKFVVVFVGTFGQWHGVEVLAESVRQLAGDIPQLHLLMVGDGVLRPVIEEIFDSTGMRNRVTITGNVPHSEVAGYLAAADVLVSPHVDNPDGTAFFGSPTKLFEYMAIEKPIIASNVGQISSVLSHEETALLVEQRNTSALCEAISRLYKDKNLAASLALNARRHVLDTYTWEQNARRVQTIFETIRR